MNWYQGAIIEADEGRTHPQCFGLVAGVLVQRNDFLQPLLQRRQLSRLRAHTATSCRGQFSGKCIFVTCILTLKSDMLPNII